MTPALLTHFFYAMERSDMAKSKRRESYTVKINNVEWTIRMVDPGPWTFDTPMGECSHPESNKREILISNRLEGEELVEIIIHEMLHASMWIVSEETVDQTAKDISQALAIITKEAGKA